jgi:hypothetical protein
MRIGNGPATDDEGALDAPAEGVADAEPPGAAPAELAWLEVTSTELDVGATEGDAGEADVVAVADALALADLCSSGESASSWSCPEDIAVPGRISVSPSICAGPDDGLVMEVSLSGEVPLLTIVTISRASSPAR